MSFEINRREARRKRQVSGRRKVRGTTERPRLCVFRSTRHMSLQVINDEDGRTLVCASTMEPAVGEGLGSTGNIAAAQALGKVIAERAQAANITKVVFDRAGFPYHGRVKAVAEAAREGGLDF
jgi:large subunit ribosomal protein L18